MNVKPIVIVLFLAIAGTSATAQTDSAAVKSASQNSEVRYPSGLNLTIGTMINNKFNYHYKASYFAGNGKNQGGFTFGFNSYNFKDTSRDSAKFWMINSLGIGLTARAFTPDASSYFVVSASYLMSVYDAQFGATNGMSMSAALGFSPNKSLFFELGFTGAAFLTPTEVRPSSWGLMVNIGANL